MPLGAALAVAAVGLSGPPVATAATTATTATTAPATTSSLDEAPVPGQVAATVIVADTEKLTVSRTMKVTVTRKLTSKVKATGTATRTRGATGSGSSTVTVTRYAPTTAEATTEARGIAGQAAHDRAAKAATTKAAAAAKAKAKKAARMVAKARANANVRKRFGTLVLRKARAQRGKPYRWGAQGPGSFDCSGFVRYVMKGVGVKGLPRTSRAQANAAHRISKSQRKPGDLVIFTSGGNVYHVAIYAGGGKIWHAPGSGRSVTKVKIWTSSYRMGRLPA
jgi:cell wall-associated NlpC family hydrolase